MRAPVARVFAHGSKESAYFKVFDRGCAHVVCGPMTARNRGMIPKAESKRFLEHVHAD